MKCPICKQEHQDDRPVLVNGVLHGRGCQACYERQGGRQTEWSASWMAVSGRTATVDGLEPETLRERPGGR